MVFVDISGFTALTERLARKGKVGAEMMRDTLDGVFTALLDEAYEWGAGLLKWGGDALLLMFDGDRHAERAARAAWEMQGTIDRVGRLHVSGGTIVLRMSVGIGTGQYQFFMTGSIHRELLIAGPVMTETLAMEAIADAGEIGISPAMVARLPVECIGPQKDGVTLLAAAPPADRRRAPDVGDIGGLDIASCIPVAARAHVLLKKAEPEHRTITAAFIDMMDTDRLLEELGPEALGRGLDHRMRSIQEAALRYEVPFYETDIGKSSVKALLTAGAPSSTGHDEERMLRTLRDIMEQDGLVPMRIGVNTGKVFTGDFGPPYRRAYRVFGDAINTAARVMSKADAGQILSTDIVFSRSRTIFDTTPIPPFAAKGKSEPVKASIVGPAIGLKASHHGGLALLGRTDELAALLDAIERARAHQGSIVEVAGGPGMGKTRLIEEVVARSPDFRPITTRCEEYEASTPYFPFRAILRDVLDLDAGADADEVIESIRGRVGELDPGLAPWIPLLGILLGLDMPDTPETATLDARFLRDRLTEIALRFLAGSLEDIPTVLVIEDAHHLDEASQDLLLRLSVAAADKRQLLIVTHEGDRVVFPTEDDGPATMTIDLRPLSEERTIAILELATAEDPLRPHEVAEIARRSGGNPLFLFQLLDTVRTTGTIEALPDSIEALISGEIDQLAPTDRTILRYASVMGSSFDPALLISCVRDEMDFDDDVWSRLGALLTREVDGGFRFRSTLIRDAAYEGLPYRRRRALHGRIGETIESVAGDAIEEQVGALALHYSEAQRWDKAWRFCSDAGNRAMEVYANVEATRFFAKALMAGRRLRSVSPEDLAGLYERNADTRFRLGEFKAADKGFDSARRLLGRDPVRTAPLVVRQAASAIRTGDLQRAATRAQVGLRRLEGLRGREAAASRARLLVSMAAVRYFQNRYSEGIDWGNRAIREAKRGHAQDALAEAYKMLDLSLWESGDIARATHGVLALAIYEELGDIRNQALILNNMGAIAHDTSRWEESSDLYRRGLALADKIGDRSLGALMKFNLTEILIDRGLYDEAEPLIREVIRLWRAAGAEADVAEANRELARSLAQRGEFEGAHTLLDGAREYQAGAAKMAEVLRTDVRRIEVLLLEGDALNALQLLEHADRMAATTDGGQVVETSLARLRGCAYAQNTQYDAADERLRWALNDARHRDERFEEALVLDALASIGQRAGTVDPGVVAARDALFNEMGLTAAPAFVTGFVPA
ncbi:MAG: AAA family ATPase [Chloroflexi bacterium]|nr:AAA family ATPase [Chloroflexota bacterium]